MIISRGFRLANLVNKTSRGIQCSHSNISVRNCHGGKIGYRSFLTPTEKQVKSAEFIGALVWGWIFYHVINDYDMLLGEYYSPNPALWTDEELGIPPDDAGPYVFPQ